MMAGLAIKQELCPFVCILSFQLKFRKHKTHNYRLLLLQLLDSSSRLVCHINRGGLTIKTGKSLMGWSPQPKEGLGMNLSCGEGGLTMLRDAPIQHGLPTAREGTCPSGSASLQQEMGCAHLAQPFKCPLSLVSSYWVMGCAHLAQAGLTAGGNVPTWLEHNKKQFLQSHCAFSGRGLTWSYPTWERMCLTCLTLPSWLASQSLFPSFPPWRDRARRGQFLFLVLFFPAYKGKISHPHQQYCNTFVFVF